VGLQMQLAIKTFAEYYTDTEYCCLARVSFLNATFFLLKT